MDDREIKGYLTDINGTRVREIREGDRIRSGASTDAYRTKKIREAEAVKAGDKQEWNLEHFFKGHIPEIRELMKSLTTFERAFLFSIATYVGYEDCCLKYDNGKCLDFNDLVVISGMSRGKASDVLSSLIKSDIIYKGINSKGIQYFVNPWIYCKGIRINKVLQTMFKNYCVRILGGKQWGKVVDLEEKALLKKVEQLTGRGT